MGNKNRVRQLLCGSKNEREEEGSCQAAKNKRDKKERTKAELELSEPWSKPRGWKEYGFYKFRKHFECGLYAKDQTKAMPKMEDWHSSKKRSKDTLTILSLLMTVFNTQDDYSDCAPNHGLYI